MNEKENYGNILSGLTTEIIFTLLPFVVSIVIFANQSTILDIFQESEWSVAAAVLFGQSSVKLIQGALSAQRANVSRILLLLALLIVFGLVPALTIVVLVLTTDPLSLSLVLWQVFIFIASIVVFLGLGAVSEILVLREQSR